MKFFLSIFSLLFAVFLVTRTCYAGDESPQATAAPDSQDEISADFPDAPDALTDMSIPPQTEVTPDDMVLPGSFVFDSPDTPEAEKGFRNALRLFEAGSWKQAHEKALETAGSYQSTPWEGRSQFLAARASLKLGAPESAAVEFAAARKTMPWLGDQMLYMLAGGYADRNMAAEAADAYQLMVEKYPKSPLADDSYYRAAQSLTDLGRYDDAVRLLLALIKRKPGSELVIKANGLMFVSDMRLGRINSALVRYRSLWLDYPWSAVTTRATDTLATSGITAEWTAADYIHRGGAYYAKSQYRLAAGDYLTALTVIPSATPEGRRLNYLLGRCYYRMKENVAAERYLRMSIEGHPFQKDGPDILFSLARTYLRMKDETRYRDTVMRCARDFPGNPKTVDALYMLGTTMCQGGDPDSAIEIFSIIGKDSPGSDRMDEALWQVGWAYYCKGDYASSAAILTVLTESFPTSTLVSQALYWKARSLEAEGNISASQAVFAELIKRYPVSFYALFMGQGGALTAIPTASPVIKDGQAAGTEFNNYKDVRLIRALEFGIQGLKQAAVRELRRAEPSYGGSMAGINSIAGLYSFLGVPGRLMDLASGLYERNLKMGVAGIPEDGLKLIFPLGYWDVLSREATALEIDPFLAAGIIREESRFNPGAASPAGALGLMQLMPSTAKKVCRKMNLKFTSNNQLLDHRFNIPVGMCYLSTVIEKNHGRLVYALAEYNAGPGGLNKWIKANPDAPDDVFIENIDYKETRGYVKKVLRNYYVYRMLYGTGAGGK